MQNCLETSAYIIINEMNRVRKVMNLNHALNLDVTAVEKNKDPYNISTMEMGSL